MTVALSAAAASDGDPLLGDLPRRTHRPADPARKRGESLCRGVAGLRPPRPARAAGVGRHRRRQPCARLQQRCTMLPPIRPRPSIASCIGINALGHHRMVSPSVGWCPPFGSDTINGVPRPVEPYRLRSARRPSQRRRPRTWTRRPARPCACRTRVSPRACAAKRVPTSRVSPGSADLAASLVI